MKTIDVLVEELPKRGGWPDGAIGAGFLSGEGTLYFWDKNNDCPPKWTIETDIEVEDSDEEVTHEQYEAALAAKNDGWIDWGGGKHPPVSTNTVVDVKFKGGGVQSGYQAGEYSWEHAWQDSNIIAYRLHQSQEAELAEADDEIELNECIGRDAAPVWNGEGVTPPVGCVCERSWAGNEWLQCEIIFTGNEIVLVKLATREAAYHLSDVRFRPIRSEAERKRDEAAQALCYAGGGNGKVDEKADYGSCWFDVYDAIAAGKIPGVKLDD